MLERTVLSDIRRWKKYKTHQGLLITGAHQVGKTTTVRQFAREAYGSFVEINFLENPSAMEVISRAKDTQDMALRITALADTPLVPQRYPRVL